MKKTPQPAPTAEQSSIETAPSKVESEEKHDLFQIINQVITKNGGYKAIDTISAILAILIGLALLGSIVALFIGGGAFFSSLGLNVYISASYTCSTVFIILGITMLIAAPIIWFSELLQKIIVVSATKNTPYSAAKTVDRLRNSRNSADVIRSKSHFLFSRAFKGNGATKALAVFSEIFYFIFLTGGFPLCLMSISIPIFFSFSLWDPFIAFMDSLFTSEVASSNLIDAIIVFLLSCIPFIVCLLFAVFCFVMRIIFHKAITKKITVTLQEEADIELEQRFGKAQESDSETAEIN